MSGAVLGSRRIRCGWAQHKQETSSASFAAVDRVRCLPCLSLSLEDCFLLILVMQSRTSHEPNVNELRHYDCRWI